VAKWLDAASYCCNDVRLAGLWAAVVAEVAGRIEANAFASPA
jgi:hypothetical protein